MSRPGQICAIMLLLLIPVSAQPQVKQLLPVVMGGKYGLIDIRGNLVLEASYDMIFDFGRENFSIVRQGNFYGAIDISGQVMIACLEDSIDYLGDSIFAVKKDGGWTLKDFRGTVLTDSIFESFNTAGSDLISFKKNNYYGLLNHKGRIVVPPEYDKFYCINNMVYTFRNGSMGLYDTKGTKYLEATNDMVLQKNNQVVFYEKDGKHGYVSLVSGKVISAEWDEVRLLQPYSWNTINSSGYEVVVVRNEKLGLYVSGCDCRVLEPEYDAFQVLMPGYILYKTHARSGLLAASGKRILKPVYNEISYLGAAYFKFNLNGKCGIADTNGCILVSAKYSKISYLQQDNRNMGLFAYEENGKWGLLRSDSSVLTPAVYKSIEVAGSSFLIVKNNARYGIIDLKGTMLHDFIFDKVSARIENMHTVFDGKLVGLMNSKGELLAKPVYDKITVVDKTYKAYRNDNLEIFWLNENYEIAESMAYQGISSVHVTDANARVIQWTPPLRTDTLRRVLFAFYYSDADAKWGLKEVTSGKVAISPQFDRVEQAWSARFALVFVKTDTIRFEIDNCRFYSMQACGMVDLYSGALVLKPEYLDIDLTMGRYGYWFVRLISTTGTFGYANALGTNLGDYSFISPFKQRKARVNVGGELLITDKEGPNTVNPLGAFIDGFKCRLRYADSYTRNMVLSEKSKIMCEGGTWGQLYFNLNRADFARFDWISKDYGGSYIVRVNNQSQLMRDGNFIRISGINYYDYLTTLNQQPYFVISKNYAKYGFIDTTGHFITDICYDHVFDFSEGLAAVKTNNHWGFIGLDGSLVIPAVYDAVKSFCEGYAAVKSGTKWGYITTEGDTAIACQYNKAGNFCGGLAAVRKAGKALFIDTKGQNTFGITFITGRDFTDGYAIASDRNGTGVINNSGAWVIPPKYDRVTVLDPVEGVVVVARKNKYGLMSLSGEKLTPLKYDALRKSCDGMMAARSRNSWGFISTAGKMEIPFRYYDVRNFSCNRSVVNVRGHWGVIDRNNHMVIEAKYGVISSFSEGICFAGMERGLNIMIDTNGVVISDINRFRMLKNFSEGKSVIVDDYHDSGFVGRDGKLLFGRRFSDACSFSGSTAVVKEGGEWGIIDDKGTWVVPPSYDSIHDFVEGRAVVGVLKHEGLADSRGNICIQPEFQSVEMAPYGLIRVRQNGAMGYVDLAGREIWKPTK